MSVLIGDVREPCNNSPHVAADVWCSPGQVELSIHYAGDTLIPKDFDPIAARNLAALLVRASEEAERMAARRERPRDDTEQPAKDGCVEWPGFFGAPGYSKGYCPHVPSPYGSRGAWLDRVLASFASEIQRLRETKDTSDTARDLKQIFRMYGDSITVPK